MCAKRDGTHRQGWVSGSRLADITPLYNLKLKSQNGLKIPPPKKRGGGGSNRFWATCFTQNVMSLVRRVVIAVISYFGLNKSSQMFLWWHLCCCKSNIICSRDLPPTVLHFPVFACMLISFTGCSLADITVQYFSCSLLYFREAQVGSPPSSSQFCSGTVIWLT